MITRRSLLMGTVSAGLIATMPGIATAAANKFVVARKYRPRRVRFKGYPVGTIVVDTPNHYLYWVDKRNRAMRYGVGVGRAGLKFKGTAIIGRKAKWPRWTPTANMIKREPKRYAKYAGGLPGGPNNPLGARALYLYVNGRDTYFRIHGTNQPQSIGTSASSGCIRMINAHVEDLYERVPKGTRVIVL